MIGLIAMIVTGLAFNLKLAFVSPVIYLFKFRKNLALIAFSAYCIAFGYYLKLGNIYKISYVDICVAISLILILEDCIKNKFEEIIKSKPTYVLSALIISGLLFKPIILPALTLAVLYTFTEDIKSILFAILCICFLAYILFIFKSFLNQLGSASTQVVFLSAFSLLISLLFWKGKERTDFKL